MDTIVLSRSSLKNRKFVIVGYEPRYTSMFTREKRSGGINKSLGRLALDEGLGNEIGSSSLQPISANIDILDSRPEATGCISIT